MRKIIAIILVGVFLTIASGWGLDYYLTHRSRNFGLEQGPIRYTLQIVWNGTNNYTIIAPIALKSKEDTAHPVMNVLRPEGNGSFRIVESIYGPAIEVSGNSTFFIGGETVTSWEWSEQPRLSLLNPKNQSNPWPYDWPYSYWVYCNCQSNSDDGLTLYVYLTNKHHIFDIRYRVIAHITMDGWQIVNGTYVDGTQ